MRVRWGLGRASSHLQNCRTRLTTTWSRRALANRIRAVPCLRALLASTTPSALTARGSCRHTHWNLPLLAEVGREPIGLAWNRIDESSREVANLYQSGSLQNAGAWVSRKIPGRSYLTCKTLKTRFPVGYSLRRRTLAITPTPTSRPTPARLTSIPKPPPSATSKSANSAAVGPQGVQVAHGSKTSMQMISA